MKLFFLAAAFMALESNAQTIADFDANTNGELSTTTVSFVSNDNDDEQGNGADEFEADRQDREQRNYGCVTWRKIPGSHSPWGGWWKKVPIDCKELARERRNRTKRSIRRPELDGTLSCTLGLAAYGVCIPLCDADLLADGAACIP